MRPSRPTLAEASEVPVPLAFTVALISPAGNLSVGLGLSSLLKSTLVRLAWIHQVGWDWARSPPTLACKFAAPPANARTPRRSDARPLSCIVPDRSRARLAR